MGNWPSYCDGLMNTTPGSIARRFPTYWYDGEGGIDWGVKPGQPIIALADGVIAGAGYFCHSPANYFMSSPYPCNNPDYGVVTTRVTNSDGSQTDLYYQHINIAKEIRLCDKGIGSCGGQRVKKGDIIGYGNPGGFFEMGINVGNSPNPPPWPNGWGGIWGADKSPGPHVDPEPYIRKLISAYSGSTSGTVISGNGTTGVTGVGVGGTGIAGTLTQLIYSTPFQTIQDKTNELITTVPGFSGVILALDNVEKFQAWQLPTSGGNDTPVLGGVVNGINAVQNIGKLPADAIQATLVFVVSNTGAFLVRALIVIIGVIIVTTLLRNMLGITPQNAIKLGESVGAIAL